MPLVHLTDLISKPDNTYAIGAFNVSDMEMAMGAIKAAEELEAPLILQIAEGRLRYSPLDLLGPVMIAAAKKCKMPTAVHLDHGSTMETIKLALDLGFTSVMFDGSKYPLDENIARTKEVVKLAKSYGADVEARLAASAARRVTTRASTSSSRVSRRPSALLRSPASMRWPSPSARLTATTKRSRSSASIAQGDPCSRQDAARPARRHGPDGNGFRTCLANGIQKINIATASYDASAAKIKEVAAANPQAKYFDFSDAIVQGTYENVKKHMHIFGLEHKA